MADVIYTPKNELHPDVQPLTASEKKWIANFTRVMKSIPERFMVRICGDMASILDYDAIQIHELEYDRSYAFRDGFMLADVPGAASTFVCTGD